LNLHGIDWVILGGGGARRPRLMKEEWVLDIWINAKPAMLNSFSNKDALTKKKT
jgi:protein gp37